MTKVIKKSIPWFLIISLILTTVLAFNFMSSRVEADSADTSVTVGNTTPTFNSGYEPHEDAASDGTTPTNVGSDVTFKATATDANSDDWKLLICASAGTTGVTCTGTVICNTAVAVTSNTEATCSYTALVGDSKSNDWYGYACDPTGCSGEDHKTDASGPPFKVNHSPLFTVFADDGPKGPNTTITWTTTASDSDDDTAQDTISLYVCMDNDFTGTVCGVGGTWCSSIADADGDPTCNETTPRPDGDYTAYAYIIDSHNLVSVGTAQGTDSSPTVTNSSPSITNTSINLLDVDGSGNLELVDEQSETANFTVTFIVNDDNSCETKASGDEISSAFINLRMSEKATGACDESGEYNANDCYPDLSASWDPVCAASTTVDTCTDDTDTTVGWSCTFPLQYHADPTVTGTPKAAYTWIAAVQAEDDNAANTGLIDSSTGSNDIDKFMSYDLNTASIAYGTVAPDADSLEQTTIIEATGNVGLDENLLGSQLCNDYSTCADSDDIPIAQQHYNLSQGAGWAAGTELTDGLVESELDCTKTTITGTPETKSTYWYLHVPLGQGVDSYTGENTIEGKVNNELFGA